MRYDAHRQKIKSGDLLAWSHRAGWFRSWYDFKINLVRLFTRSEYSHVGVAWVFGGRVFVIESVTPLVRIVPLSNLLPCYHVGVTGGWNDQAEFWALSHVGKAQYSQWEAVKAVFGWNDRKNAFTECAEFAHSVYDCAGLRVECRDTPTDLVLAVQRLGGAMTYLEAQ